jgi:NADH dehydrogenase
LRQIVEYVQTVTGRRRFLMALPPGMARLQAGVIEFVDKLTLGLLPDEFIITRDQVLLLGRDNVVSEEAARQDRTFQGIGIEPSGYEAIVPSYLWRFRKTGQFDVSRTA